MPLSEHQISTLIGLVATTTPDGIDCDGCLDHIAEYAETQLAEQSISDALVAVETHLVNCPCCQKEFETLLDAIQGMEE